ncbi:MAG: hypothetical protein ACE5G7_04860 [Candidatus Hydrothermarchaeaceae archaeon]
MRDRISSIIKELQFATSDEIKMVLGEARKKTIDHNLKNMVDSGEVIRIFPDETTLKKEGFIEGPNLEVHENFQTRQLLVEKDLSERRDVIKWRTIADRLVEELSDKLGKLIEDIDKQYRDPKNLELDYFDYSIKYHELYRILNERVDSDALKELDEIFKKCRLFLDKLNYRETP